MGKQFKFGVLLAVALLFSIVSVACRMDNQSFNIGVLQWSENIEIFNQTYESFIAGLNDKGYKLGVNLKIAYKNVEQNEIVAIKTVQKMISDKIDLIVALGGGSCIASLKATEGKEVPIVCSVGSDLRYINIMKNYYNSGKNITGISMKIPLREQFLMIKKVLPKLQKLGILYCAEMPQMVALGRKAIALAPEFGWTPLPVFISKNELPQLEKVIKTLTSKIDAIYISVDPILLEPENLKKIIRVCDENRTPVITGTKESVEAGALMALHCDFSEIGRQTAHIVSQVLKKVDINRIPITEPTITILSLNLKKAQQLSIQIDHNIILQAENIFD
ncbi:MAG: ABC transporter substrate-binding protein [Desulfobacterales bacterium]|nr:ABC transporter substrate-binding protein [Desulfobacterales bacterium]